MCTSTHHASTGTRSGPGGKRSSTASPARRASSSRQTRPPFVERHVAPPDRPQPVGLGPRDRQGQRPGGEQLDALVAEPGAVHGVLRVVAVGGDQLLAPAAAPPAVASAPGAKQPHGLRLHVPAVARHDVAADEGVGECPELVSVGGRLQHGGPERHEDRRVPARRHAHEAAQRVQRAVGVARPRPGPLGLGPLHDRAQPAVVEPDHLCRRLDDDAHLVVVLAAGDAGAVGGGADLDQQDRGRGQGRDLEHRHSLGSTGSLSRASTPNTHSWTRCSGSPATNRSSASMPRANSRRASERLWPRPRDAQALEVVLAPCTRVRR